MTINIAIPSNFSFAECLWFLDRGYDECLHAVANQKVRKLFEFNNEPVLVEISEQNQSLIIEVLTQNLHQPQQLIDVITEWFDLEKDVTPFYERLKTDRDLAFLADKYAGLRLISIPNLFEVMCWSIIGQQINLTFAYKIKRALVETYGKSINYQGQKYYMFPQPTDLLNVEPEALKEMKFSRQKIDYILGIAHAFANQAITKDKVLAIKTHAERLKFLTNFRGIGEWTAQYSLMKSLRSTQSIPYGDSGINQAMYNLKNIPKKGGRAAQEAVFNNFSGHEAYLVFYLWRSLSGG
jgi:DNA-3-methyladenine glycosylase II